MEVVSPQINCVRYAPNRLIDHATIQNKVTGEKKVAKFWLFEIFFQKLT
jgi:hypothetical protein